MNKQLGRMIRTAETPETTTGCRNTTGSSADTTACSVITTWRANIKSGGYHMVDTDWYVLVLGIESLGGPIILSDGLEIRPLASTLSVFDLANAGASGFKEWAVLEPVTSLCTVEIFSRQQQGSTTGYDTLNRAWLATTLLLLRGYNRIHGIACSSYSWSAIAGSALRPKSLYGDQNNEASYRREENLPKFQGGLLDYHHHSLRNIEPCRIDSKDSEWIAIHFESCARIASESNSFRFALEAAEDWRFAKESRSAVARIWSGIEAIFGISSELVYRVSLYSASLLVERGEARKTKFDKIKRLYSLRSKVIHGEQVSDEDIHKCLTGSFYLLRDLIVYSIEQGRHISDHEIDDAVFG
ncbi:MAG: hypothetical protein J0I17_00960 ['Candidatus Kapabacteria' thiocyanatum]|nr:hypothetical protein ['Candidatus Kapabacteria' thiocyanatum]